MHYGVCVRVCVPSGMAEDLCVCVFVGRRGIQCVGMCVCLYGMFCWGVYP